MATTHAPPGAGDLPYTFEVIPLDHIFIDDAYQRPLSRFYKRIVDSFNPALLGTLVLSERAKNRYACIDGQTRWTALKALGHQEGPALVFRGLTQAQEAGIFRALDTQRKNITALESFRAAITSGDPDAQAVKDIAEKAGFVIEKTGQGNSIHAVRALEDVVRKDGPEMLERALGIIQKAWRHQSQGGNSNELIRGLVYFLEREKKVDDEKLVRRLSVIDPDVLHTRAAQLRQGRGMGGKSSSYMAEVIRLEYKRRKPTRMPEAQAA
jgi:hypothetical protein